MRYLFFPFFPLNTGQSVFTANTLTCDDLSLLDCTLYTATALHSVNLKRWEEGRRKRKEMLPGSLVGCVRWCGRKGASMSLYEEALGCSLASHHLLLPLLSSPPSALLPRDKACWMPVFCARSSWIAQVEKKGFQMHRLQEENLVMVVDQNGASALLVESSQAPKLGLSGPWVAHNSQHPFSPGEMCWQDLLTTSGKEQEMASVW